MKQAYPLIITLICLILFSFVICTVFQSLYWLIVTALATVVLAYIAGRDLGGVNKVSRGEFIYKLKKDFFNNEAMLLNMLFDYDVLEFKEDEHSGESYFEIKKGQLKSLHLSPKLKADLMEKGFYSAFEIDDGLLGHFEDIAAFEERGLIDMDFIYDEFDWYIETIWNNGEIQKYIEQQNRDEETKDIYEGFKYIFDKVVVRRKRKNNKRIKSR